MCGAHRSIAGGGSCLAWSVSASYPGPSFQEGCALKKTPTVFLHASAWRKATFLSSTLGHHLTVPRFPRGEKEKSKTNTDIKVIVGLKQVNENDDACADHKGSEWWEMLLG